MDYEFRLASKSSRDSKPEMFRVDGTSFTRFEKNAENRWVKAEVQPVKSELTVRVDGLRTPTQGSAIEILGAESDGRRIVLRVIDDMGGEGLKQSLAALQDGKGIELQVFAYRTDYTDMLSGKPSAEAIVDEAGIRSARSIEPALIQKNRNWIGSGDLSVERKELQSGGTLVVIKDKRNPYHRFAASDHRSRDRFLEALSTAETIREVKGTEKVVLQSGRLFQVFTVEGFDEPQRKMTRSAEASR